jgi:hypothetical protein
MTVESALTSALSGMVSGPSCLKSAVNFYLGSKPFKKCELFEVIDRRLGFDPNDKIRELIQHYLSKWDYAERDIWVEDTKKNTIPRRDLILKRLKLPSNLIAKINYDIPVFTDTREALIESQIDLSPDWFTKEFAATHNFYWQNVVKNLEDNRIKSSKGKSEVLKTVASIDSITNSILNRISNPRNKVAQRRKGLVVGYVQSGKTTNFISLVAKAIDSGYKIIIVLAGLTDLLRKQTQKRVDMDLIGVEQVGLPSKEPDNISEHEYASDSDWPSNFIQYGCRPGEKGNINIDRITTSLIDFSYSSTGTNRLRIVKKNKRLPLFEEQNIQHADAKVIIIKKEAYRLGYLIQEILDLSEKERNETPVLIIDDESDQASVNTKAENKDKSAINKKITKIIQLFKRAQYIGYTATPFANVFINPKDNQDLFPSDFIFSLDRPPNYMGPKEFTDVEESTNGEGTNEACHVRDINTKDEKATLQEALDAFLISGAIKCYREKLGGLGFKHHTMLFHQSTSKGDHQSALKKINDIWQESKYDSPRCFERLEEVFADFRRTWKLKGGKTNLHFPPEFAAIRKYALGESLARIRSGSVVIKVNSDKDGEAPDFSGSRGIWKVLVGGAKLSRGYTVEGLTISFFQRNSNTQDTLMQMGRWFGYRDGFEDLIRLYISRNILDRRGLKHDLYEKFESLCKDEEDFRKRLSIYSHDKSITPQKVAVFVFNSHPFYKPTARHKMRYAQVVSAYSDYREPTKQSLNKKSDMFHNITTFQQELKNKDFTKTKAVISLEREKGPIKANGEFFVAKLKTPGILNILNNIKWENQQNQISPEIKFISDNKNKFEEWLFVAPIIHGKNTFPIADVKIPCLERTIADTRTRINAFNSPKDVVFAKWLVSQGDSKAVSCSALRPNNERGVLLFWPVLIKDSKKLGPRKGWPPVTGFALAMPQILSPQTSTIYAVPS